MEIGISWGENSELIHARVDIGSVGMDERPTVIPNENIFNDSRRYEVYYTYFIMEIMSSNIISENILAQVYEEVKLNIILDEVIDHSAGPNAVLMSDICYEIRNGSNILNSNTRGWGLFIH